MKDEMGRVKSDRKSMPTKPLVSIVCITYNHEKYIAQALDSFLMQETDFPFEIIIHDDASTDKTADIIRDYVKKNTNSRIIFKPIYETKNQYSSGTYDFLNDMFRSVRGTYLAICEGDDYWTNSKKLQLQVDYLKDHPDYGFCFHRVEVVDELGKSKGHTVPSATQNTGFTTEELIKRNFIQTNSVLYRAQDYSVMPNSIMPHDWYLHLYHAQFGKIGFIDKIMAAYRVHEGGTWHNSYKQIDEIWRKHGINWLGLYVEVLSMYGKNPKYRELIEGSIITTFNTLADIDEKYNDSLLEKAVAKYPADAKIYISDLRKQSKQLNTHSQEQAKIIKYYVDQSERLEVENKHLKTKTLVRLKGAIKRRVKEKHT